MVYYRKYRPQTIADLDSEKLRETLYAVLAAKEVPHAFLFTGPKGLGKTSTARIVAKVVNCEHVEKGNENTLEPDNVCEQCVSITNGSSIDVLEIDGASNRGIDEIRDLREKIKLAPSTAKKKVYIIDEVHMLTTEAFNALLKTIEEPPLHAMFIFCTTEPHKVPATILSRCFHISFTLATEQELVHSLERIAIGEKITIEKDALQIIAHMAEGGFRDGAKILEELVALANEKSITKEFVEEKYQISNITSIVSRIMVHIAEKNRLATLQVIQDSVQQGVDMKYLLTQLLDAYHTLLLHKTGVLQNKIYEQFDIYTIEDIEYLVLLLSEAYQQIKFAVIPQLPLEIAIIRAIDTNEEIQIVPEVMYQQKKNTTIDSLIKKQHMMKVNTILRPEPKVVINKKPIPPGEQADITTPIGLMDNLIYKIKPLNHSLAGVLRGCTINSITQEAVIFETLYKFHKERLEERKSYEIIEKSIREITGKPLRIIIQIKQ